MQHGALKRFPIGRYSDEGTLKLLKPPPPLQVPATLPIDQLPVPIAVEENGNKRQWMPKMDFPKFDGTGVRIWLDQCESFFLLYSIPESFRVTSASLNLVGNATHWFQSYKQMGI